MVEQLQQLSTQLMARGTISLFLIAKMDEFADKWTLIFAGSWVTDETTRQATFQEIWTFLNSHLSQEERLTIARIGVFSPTEPLINKFNAYFSLNNPSSQPPFRAMNFKVNGNVIYDAVVITLNRENPLTTL